MWCFCMMPQGNLPLVSFQVWFIIPFTPSHSSMRYNITMVLSSYMRMLLDLTSSIMVCGTGRILMGITLQVHKRKVVPKPHRSQNSIHCGKDAVTFNRQLQQCADKISAVYFQSVGWCRITPHLLGDLYKLLYLQKNTCITDPSPSYHWYLVRKTDISYWTEWDIWSKVLNDHSRIRIKFLASNIQGKYWSILFLHVYWIYSLFPS